MPVTRQVTSSSPSSSVYLQTCSVCSKDFSRQTDWLKHLTEMDHQKLARKECIATWSSKLRKCCLIVYTSDPLTVSTAAVIVGYFSKGINGSLVTDFVYWEDRPNIGILQFESREKAKHILKSSVCQNSSKVHIGNSQSVQVKNGSDLLEFEWNAIRPPRNSQRLATLKTKRHTNQVTFIDTSAISENSYQEPQPHILEANQNVRSPPFKRKRTLKDNGRIETDPPEHGLTKPFSVAISQGTLSPFPWTRASHPLRFEYWNIRKDMYKPDPPIRKDCVMDVQAARLLEYMYQFDPRSNSLITLVTDWATINSINVAGQVDSENLLELPSHYTIKWLVIFFLCFEKYIPTPRQILSRNRDKIEPKDLLTGANIGFHCDSTFVEEWKSLKGTSQKHVDDFSDEFLLGLVQLLWKFLVFCHTALGGTGSNQEKVAILQDGNFTSIESIMSTIKNIKGSSHWRKSMTFEEIDTLKNTLKKEKSSEDFCGIHMTHPFLFSHKINLAKDIKSSLKRYTYKNLHTFLSRVEQVGVKASLKEVGGLKKLLTVSESQ